MSKKRLATTVLSLLTSYCFAQQWTGSTDVNNGISRNGDINVSGLGIGRYRNPLSGDTDPYTIYSIDGQEHDLTFYGSNSATLNLRLYDGALKFGPDALPTTILFNDGRSSFGGNMEIKGSLFMGGQSATRWNNSISSYVVESNHFYGHTSTDQIWIGELNPTMIRGSLGIGTNFTPWAKLHLMGDNGDANTGIFRLDGNSGGASLRFGIHTNYAWIQSHNGSPLSINDIGNNTFINAQSGNVGIGTRNPDQKLTVNGKIKAEEVSVVVDVPADYVFDQHYAIQPLDSVERFVLENHHLPNMPSASEIKANGWNVAEMGNKMLEKIEELTLYVIELKKANMAMRAELDALSEPHSKSTRRNRSVRHRP